MVQVSFDPIDLMDSGMGYEDAHKAMRVERDRTLRSIRKEGGKAFGFTLRGQLRPYRSFGVPCGKTRNVFMLDQVSR